VTQNIITAKEIREGDKIRVTTVDGDRHNSFEGVANHYQRSAGTPNRRWFTAEDWTLWTGDESAVIELLDRPKPKIKLPTGKHAVIQYRLRSNVWTATFNGLEWTLSEESFPQYPQTRTVGQLTEMLNSGERTDYKVLFEGVAE